MPVKNFYWSVWDSNPQPLPHQSNALTYWANRSAYKEFWVVKLFIHCFFTALQVNPVNWYINFLMSAWSFRYWLVCWLFCLWLCWSSSSGRYLLEDVSIQNCQPDWTTVLIMKIIHKKKLWWKERSNITWVLFVSITSVSLKKRLILTSLKYENKSMVIFWIQLYENSTC